MRIQSDSAQIPTTKTPNFKAIKSVRCEGLYKKYPEYGQELVETFKQNPKAMEFCKEYDVDIVFHAFKRAVSSVESSIRILFKNPAKKSFLGILGNARDEIALHGFGNRYDEKLSLRQSTANLKNYIAENVPGKTSGVLNSHIESKEEEIKKALDKKAAKLAKKQEKAEIKNNSKNKMIADTEKLQDSIQDLINQSYLT